MCLIVIKPVGKPFPSNKDMKRWFDLFPDGTGISFQDKGKVRTLKGAMTIKEMKTLEDQVEKYLKADHKKIIDIVAMIQFRAAFTGSVSRKFCHPFPITKNQDELDSCNVISEKALAHNGVIWEYNSYNGYYHQKEKWHDINDAQEFIRDYLVDMGESIWNPSVQKLIESYTESKFAILSGNKFALIGEFIGDNGYLFSNAGYKKHTEISQQLKSSVRYLPTQMEVGGKLVNDAYDAADMFKCEMCGEWTYEEELIEYEDMTMCRDCFNCITQGMPRKLTKQYPSKRWEAV